MCLDQGGFTLSPGHAPAKRLIAWVRPAPNPPPLCLWRPISEHAPGHGIKPGDKARIARFGCCEHGEIEGAVTTMRARRAVRRERCRDPADHVAGLFGIA